MAVTKLDISLAARSASHLYVTTALGIYLIFYSLTSELIWAGLNPFSLIPIATAVCYLVLGIGYLGALYYARREVNYWAYIIAIPIPVLMGLNYLEKKSAAGVILALYFVHVLIDYSRLIRSPVQARFTNEVSKLLRKRRSLLPWIHAPTDPSRTCVYAILSLFLYLVFNLIFRSAMPQQGQEPRGLLLGYIAQDPLGLKLGYIALAFAVAMAALAGAVAMAALARRHYALRADRALELDNRRPILFLRSFADDKVRLWGKGFYGKLRRKTIDEAIEDLAERLGPFVAIANPHTNLPRLGAAQTYFSNDTWQNAITRWVQMAEMVVMVAGRTEGLRWELDHILADGRQAKLVIFLPPALRKDSVAAARWFSENFSHTRYGEDLSTIDLRRVIGIAFREDGLFVVETRRVRRREVDYLVALQAIIFAMFVKASAQQQTQASETLMPLTVN